MKKLLTLIMTVFLMQAVMGQRGGIQYTRKPVFNLIGTSVLDWVPANIPGFVPYSSKNQHIGLAADSLFYGPVKDTTHTPARVGALTYRSADSRYYMGISTTAGTKRWMGILKETETGISTRDRFGFSGEDVTATANRTFQVGGYTFRIGTGNIQLDSALIIGVPDETAIANAVMGINGSLNRLSFLRMWDQDDNVMRFDFRENGDIYAGGNLIWEAANTRFQASRIDLTSRVVTPIISNSPGSNGTLQMAPGASDGEVIVGNSGIDEGDYKFQSTGGAYFNITGKAMRLVGVEAGEGDSVYIKNAAGNVGLLAITDLPSGGGGGGSAGRLFKSLNANTTAAGNTGTGEDNLMTYTIPADTLNTNGDHIEFTMAFTFAANTNGKRVRVYYGATLIYDSGSQNQNSGSMEIQGTIVRTGATAQLISFSQNNDAALFPIRSGYTTAAETLSSTVVLKATAEGVSDNDIQQILLTVKMIPNS